MTTATHWSQVLRSTFRFWRSDPRHYQSTVLTSLLVYGIVCLDLEVELKQLVIIIPTTLLHDPEQIHALLEWQVYF
jgi:hypothetical protein